MQGHASLYMLAGEDVGHVGESNRIEPRIGRERNKPFLFACDLFVYDGVAVAIHPAALDKNLESRRRPATSPGPSHGWREEQRNHGRPKLFQNRATFRMSDDIGLWAAGPRLKMIVAPKRLGSRGVRQATYAAYSIGQLFLEASRYQLEAVRSGQGRGGLRGLPLP